MSDINLNSPVIHLKDFPEETSSVMIMLDERGWAIRCYDVFGIKITTMVPFEYPNSTVGHITLAPREQQ